MQPQKKSKRCRGCGELGHNLKTCVNVNLDVLYSNLIRPRGGGAALSAIESDSSSASSDDDDDDELQDDALLTGDGDQPPRKRSASHVMVEVTAKAATSGEPRRTRHGK